MSPTILLLIGIVIAVNALVLWVALRSQRDREKGRGSDQSLLLLQRELQNLSRTVEENLSHSTRAMQDSSRTMHESIRSQFSESANIIREVTEGLTKLDETNRQVVSFAGQLQSLSDVLQNPKRRGIVGEYYLETVLKNVLPPSAYKMQYGLGASETGTELIVDAAIFVQEKIIPVDSKFSLENYNRLAEEKDESERARLEQLFRRDLKARIDETAKYIRPGEGTMDFALMFIPSEAIFYDLIINKIGAVKVNTEELIQYAVRKRVNIVSPNSFYAFLQVILHGLRQIEIEKNTERIRKQIGDLEKHLKRYEEFYQKLGGSLRMTVKQFEGGRKELNKIDKDILRITGSGVGFAIEPVEEPELEEV